MRSRFVLAVILFSIPTFFALFKGNYFTMHDDLQVMRVDQMVKCLQDLQVPCRWVPDMGFGYGYPQYHYYGPLPYYLMGFVNLFKVDLFNSVKLGFALSLVLGNIFMFYLARYLWGDYAGLLSSFVYAYLPYRSSDLYSRGAMAESWSFVFLPLIIWMTLKFLDSPTIKKMVMVSISFSLLLVSHNVTTVTFGPLFVIFFCSMAYFRGWEPKKIFKYLFLILLYAVGLSAFFFMPAYLEKNLAHTESLTIGYFNYLAHFVSLKQLLFTSYWGYGSSEIGPTDDLSFFIGPIHLLLFLIAIFKSIWGYKQDKLNSRLIWISSLLFGISIFMTHQKSSFVWGLIPFLKYLQFPWRYLVPATFFASFIAGYVFYKSSNKKFVLFLFFIIFLFNKDYFRPLHLVDITPTEKMSGYYYDKELTISIFDYLPMVAKFPPNQPVPLSPFFESGLAGITNLTKTSNSYVFDLVSSASGRVVIPLYNFKGWKVKLDGVNQVVTSYSDLGLISVGYQPGFHHLSANFENTPLRSAVNITSLAFILSSIYLLRTKKYE